jgi:predicted transposase YbfD/YdcC
MENSLMHYLEQIPDFRKRGGLRHPLPLVLLIVIMAIMSGEYGYRAMARFIERHRRSLIRELSIPKSRVPSASVVRRVLLGLEYQEVQKQLNAWLKENVIIPKGEGVSGDEKALRNTVSKYAEAEQNFVNMVSLFSHGKGLVLGVKVMENQKTSEIPTVQELLKSLNLEGLVFTFDALHCQKMTLDMVVESGNDYIVKVKRNQKNLYKAIEEHTKEEEPLKTDKDTEKTRNRQSERKVEIFSVPPNLDPKWNSVGSVIKVERQGIRGDKPYHRVGYYMSSLSPNNPQLASLIRGHWQIENRLHWVKDVIQLEDKSPQKAGAAPINISLFKTWVLTLVRLHGYDSLTEAICNLSHNLRYILSFCT